MQRFLLKNLVRTTGSIALALLIVCGSHTALGQTTGSTRTAPAWLRQGVVYEVFPRQFSAEGNFNGVTARLDELKDLGVTIVWLMPIHPIGEKLRKGTYGSPYAIRDYTAVNPDYGTKEDLKRLVAQAHQRGIKVILDMVLLHTAWDNVLMSHPEFYKHDTNGNIVPPVREWTDVAGLNHENPALRKYLTSMLASWVTEADVDGFRCDTASMIPTSFWEEVRTALQQAKPDIILLAEADKPELLTQAFDIDYAWPFLTALRQVLDKGASASKLQSTWQAQVKRYPQGALHLTMSDNHDQPRAAKHFGKRGALAASALMFTLDGVPLIYNGMEVADDTESNDPALFERVPIRWDQKDGAQVRDFYRDLIKLRKAHPAFESGQVEWVSNPAPDSVVTFLRRDDKDEFLVAVNLSSKPASAKMDIQNASQFTPVAIAGQPAGDKALSDLQLDGFEWRIYRRAAGLAGKTAGGVALNQVAPAK